MPQGQLKASLLGTQHELPWSLLAAVAEFS